MSSSKPFVCQEDSKRGEGICGTGFESQFLLTQHIQRIHEGSDQVICDKLVAGVPCNRILISLCSYEGHLKDMHSPKTCEPCGEIFPDAYAYNQHFKEKHQKNFLCLNRPVCNANFPSEQERDAHVLICTPAKDRIICTYTGVCFGKFTGKGARSNYTNHLKKNHKMTNQEERKLYLGPPPMKKLKLDELPEIICTFVGRCYARFDRQKDYRKHLKYDHKIPVEEIKEYMDNLTTDEATVPNPPVQAPGPSRLPQQARPPPTPKVKEVIFQQPPPVALQAPWSWGELLTYATLTSGRIKVKIDPKLRLPIKVYQNLDMDYIRHPNFARTNRTFLRHPMIDAENELNKTDYKLARESGEDLDIGHMASRRNHIRHSDNWSASHYFAYTAPQYPSFNRPPGIWFEAEQREREFTRNVSRCHSYSGAGSVELDGVKPKVIGKMTIPSFFYKVLVGEMSGEDKYLMECYLFPHRNEVATAPLTSFYCSLDEIRSLISCDLLKDVDMSKVKMINGVKV